MYDKSPQRHKYINILYIIYVIIILICTCQLITCRNCPTCRWGMGFKSSAGHGAGQVGGDLDTLLEREDEEHNMEMTNAMEDDSDGSADEEDHTLMQVVAVGSQIRTAMQQVRTAACTCELYPFAPPSTCHIATPTRGASATSTYRGRLGAGKWNWKIERKQKV